MGHTTGLKVTATVIVLIICAYGTESGFISASTNQISQASSNQGQGKIDQEVVQAEQHGSFGNTRVERAIHKMEEPCPCGFGRGQDGKCHKLAIK
ncbi:uncharacterized protein LOC126571839 [Anopheles aquasalis]|uniref:uncharacterized protein LOC126571839 n=1 Tax=Anopheles aquasalis TaxID=42839 RepID=UPI00215B1C8B|nr:uncharacterized protein LOC126571839 [Anopheles aquasalis]